MLADRYLVPDKLTNGILTSIIEDVWMNRNTVISPAQLKGIHNGLIENEIFEGIAEEVYVSLGQERNSDPNDQIRYFNRLGFIIDDALHAANGRFNYIYRGKGLRTIWFDDGVIGLYSVYSTIDGDGFYYSLVEIDCFPTQQDSLITYDAYIQEELFSGLNSYLNPNFLFSKLAKINKKYNKDYYLEFLLNPPDVVELSDFSSRLKEECWHSLIILAKELADTFSEDKLNLIIFAMEFLISAGIEPSSETLVEIVLTIHAHNAIRSEKDKEKIIQTIKADKKVMDGKKINDLLIQELRQMNSGRNDAKPYEDLMMRVTERLFSPHLIEPNSQVSTLDKREIVDITMFNAAKEGFWHDMKFKLAAHSVYIECKNMDSLANEEFHQLSNRLSETRGLLGILIARKSDHKDLDRANRNLVHQKKVIIVLTDQDLIHMLENYYSSNDYVSYYISQKYRHIIERS